MSSQRLQKVLAQSGVASRRAAELLITEGRVRVNGRIVRELGARADPHRDRVEVDGKRLVTERPVYLLMHKPRGVVTTLDDPEGRKTVKDLLRKVEQRVFPVGRLDFQTSGALLLTNDGALAQALLHPTRAVPKTYNAKLAGQLDDERLEMLRRGVVLDDGHKTAPAEVRVLRSEPKATSVEITIAEGKNRQIHRMGEAIGHTVLRLTRISFAGLSIEGLRPGQVRALGALDLAELKQKYVHRTKPRRNRWDSADVAELGSGAGFWGTESFGWSAPDAPRSRRTKADGEAREPRASRTDGRARPGGTRRISKGGRLDDKDKREVETFGKGNRRGGGGRFDDKWGSPVKNARRGRGGRSGDKDKREVESFGKGTRRGGGGRSDDKDKREVEPFGKGTRRGRGGFIDDKDKREVEPFGKGARRGRGGRIGDKDKREVESSGKNVRRGSASRFDVAQGARSNEKQPRRGRNSQFDDAEDKKRFPRETRASKRIGVDDSDLVARRGRTPKSKQVTARGVSRAVKPAKGPLKAAKGPTKAKRDQARRKRAFAR